MENEQINPINNPQEITQDSDKLVLHDENGKFIKGHPKVGGKVAGSKSFTTKVKEALEKIAEGKDYTYEEAFIKSILKKAIVDGDASTQRLIWNYLDGMPAQRMDLGNADNLPFQIEISVKKDENKG